MGLKLTAHEASFGFFNNERNILLNISMKYEQRISFSTQIGQIGRNGNFYFNIEKIWVKLLVTLTFGDSFNQPIDNLPNPFIDNHW
jgi:hypothetical protein